MLATMDGRIIHVYMISLNPTCPDTCVLIVHAISGGGRIYMGPVDMYLMARFLC